MAIIAGPGGSMERGGPLATIQPTYVQHKILILLPAWGFKIYLIALVPG